MSVSDYSALLQVAMDRLEELGAIVDDAQVDVLIAIAKGDVVSMLCGPLFEAIRVGVEDAIFIEIARRAVDVCDTRNGGKSCRSYLEKLIDDSKRIKGRGKRECRAEKIR